MVVSNRRVLAGVKGCNTAQQETRSRRRSIHLLPAIPVHPIFSCLQSGLEGSHDEAQLCNVGNNTGERVPSSELKQDPGHSSI